MLDFAVYVVTCPLAAYGKPLVLLIIRFGFCFSWGINEM